MNKSTQSSLTLVKMLAVIAEFVPADLVPAIREQALLLQDGFDLEAVLQEQPIARVCLEGDTIAFETHDGVHGSLFPGFELGKGSLLSMSGGVRASVTPVLVSLKSAFASASDVRITAHGDIGDEGEDEVFIVDPQIIETLTFEQQT